MEQVIQEQEQPKNQPEKPDFEFVLYFHFVSLL